MDMQGTPIGSTNKGMKNTTDPATNDTIKEGAGAVASDSLAAESVNAGGDFADNRGSEPLKVKGSNSTLANDDISAATALPPARDAESRDEQPQSQGSSSTKGPAGQKYDEGAGGQPDLPGKTSAEGYSGGSTADTKSGGRDVDPAPSYVTNWAAENASKPKGDNITEGGLDREADSALAEPGSEDDPGRASLQGFQNKQAATVGSGPRQGAVTGDGQYDMLVDEQKLE
ncbi:hypothetical protein MMC26_000513 [Xylographa opegraphella]|nr:hypothetical protein [Xylographa opegraphella]